jgi:hypothetical protein
MGARRALPPGSIKYIGIGCGAILLSYATAYLPTFLVLDDYPSLADVYSNTHTVSATALAQGRLLNALFIEISFRVFNSVEAAKYIRLIGVLGTCLFFSLIVLLLVRHGISFGTSWLLALGASFLPPFIEISIWATISSYSWSCALAILGAIALQSGLLLRSRWRIAGAVLVVYAALLSYTPAAQLIFVLPLLYLVSDSRSEDSPTYIYFTFATFLTFFVASVIFMITWKLYKSAFFPYYNLNDRALVSSIGELLSKVRWFLADVLISSANLFKLYPSNYYGIGILLISLSQFLLAKGRLGATCRISCWWALLFAVYASNLLVKENWPSYRTQVAIQTYLWISFVIGFGNLVRYALMLLDREQMTNRWRYVVFGAFICIVACRQFFVVGPVLTSLHANEWDLAKRAVAKWPNQSVLRRVVFVRPDWWANSPALIRFDTFGVPSSHASWVPSPMLTVVYWSLYRHPFELSVSQLAPEQASAWKPMSGDAVLNMDALLKESAKLRSIPYP